MRLRESRALCLFIVISFFVCCHSATSQNAKRSDDDKSGVWRDRLLTGDEERDQNPVASRAISDGREEDDDSEARRDHSTGKRSGLREALEKLAQEHRNEQSKPTDADQSYNTEEERLLLIERILSETLELRLQEKEDK